MAVPLALLAGVAAAGINAASQNNRERRAMKNQMGLMREQYDNQRALNEQGAQLQLDQWKNTNYPAQMEMIKKAGLNPGLLYGMGGAGGATAGSQGGGSASGGQAPQPQQLDLHSMMSIGLMNAQKENIEADTENKKAEAGYTSGPKTENTEAETRDTMVETAIKEIEKKYKEMQEAYKTSKLQHESYEQQTKAEILMQTQQDRVEEIQELAKQGKAQTAILEAEQVIRNFEAKMTEEGISPNSPWHAKLIGDLLNKMGIMDIIKKGIGGLKTEIKK